MGMADDFHGRHRRCFAALALMALAATPAFAQRRACLASYDAVTGTIDVEAAQAATRYRLRLAVVPGAAVPRFALQSATRDAKVDCFDPTSVGTTTLAIPDLAVADSYYAATLSLVPGNGPTQVDLTTASPATLQFDLSASAKNPRLVPDAGMRISQASNPWASVGSNGMTYLGYQDRTGGPDSFQSSTNGLAFSGRTALTNANRSVDSRRTLMPDGKTWRLYQMTQAGVVTSLISSDGNTFTPEAGTRYTAPASDNGRTGVYDAYAAPDGAVVLIYLGDLFGKNNLRMARSTDNGVTFTFLKGNVLGDDDAGGGAASFVDNKTLLLPDGRRRMFTMRASELQSFVTTDGYNWTREPGIRLGFRDFYAAGLTLYSLNDPVAVIDASGRIKVYVAAATAPNAEEGPGNTSWAIVSATWSEAPGSGVIGTGTLDSKVRALVASYYQTILGRTAEAAGVDFWATEVTRLSLLGADVREAFHSMAMAFFSSAEYTARNTSDAQYLTDLYSTFFARSPDAAGLAYWQAELATVQSRSALLNSFLFSSEFAAQMAANFGVTGKRPEVVMVSDLYRGALGRLPDSAGFTFWLGEFRKAQCLGASQVSTSVANLASAFFASTEYSTRARNNRDFVGDAYNAYLRRGPGGDAAGFNFWVGQLGTMGRDGVRAQFVPSPEFQGRVAAVVQAGCL